MRITKQNILDAIETEPLRAGQWIHIDRIIEDEQTVVEECMVCAVGGVLRSKGADPSFISNYGYKLRDRANAKNLSISNMATRASIKQALEKKQWLIALSAKFETLCRVPGYRQPPATKKQRTALKKWVQKNFPDSLSIRISKA